MNSRILSGQLPLCAAAQHTTEAMRAESRKLLLRCMQEASFHLQAIQDGFRWVLQGENNVELGYSEKVGDEALARATLRLITGQAARAFRTFDL
jgi:hypothetical protein